VTTPALRRGTWLALVVAAAGVLVVSAAVAGTRGEDDRLAELVQRVSDAGAPGVLLLVREGGASRTEARGVADGRQGRAVRASDRFRIGSVTKTVVAVAVLQLVADGRIGLDDTVEQWLPGLVPAGSEITVRQLLSHASGLSDYVEDPRVLAASAHPGHAWSPRELVSIALEHPSQLEPGERYLYSSTNYVLLGLIVEAATHRPLAHALRAQVLEPLGLERTSFDPRYVRGPHVHGHRSPSHHGVVTGAAQDTSSEAATWAWAAAAIVSTADDLSRFFASLLEGHVLPPSLLREMETLVPAGSLRYGLGLAVFPTPCGDAWGHTGNAQGTVTVVWNRRDASRQVVLVVNTYPLTPELEAAVRDLEIAAFCEDA
jgi:D-alanyl-D-alanine carboxypeptidase